MACPRCALPVYGRQICGRCLKRAPHFDASRAPFAYASPLREMILAAKHGAGFHLLPFLGESLAGAVPDAQIDCLLPVPLHASRLRERGFNQSVELARYVARVSGIPVAKRAVVRDSDTRHQTGLRLQARRRNVRGAFRCVTRFDGLRVLVIDDVMTSGSTLNELARTLKMAGATWVGNAVVARAAKRAK